MSRWLCQLSYGPSSSTSKAFVFTALTLQVPRIDLSITNKANPTEFCLYIGGPKLCQGKYHSGYHVPQQGFRSFFFATNYQLSIKLLSFFRRLGCRSFRRALASIWRMRSLVTAKSCPTSSKV